MKINPITNNNNTFGSKIRYNQTLKEGFKLAKDTSSRSFKKDIDFAKNFADNIRTVLNDGKDDFIEITKKTTTYNEGYSCTESVKEIASTLEPVKDLSVETLKSHLEGAMELVEMLKEKYARAVKKELLTLERQIQKSN